jgi:hypothetical protein
MKYSDSAGSVYTVFKFSRAWGLHRAMISEAQLIATKKGTQEAQRVPGAEIDSIV